jgi:hypothetical protein
MSIFQLSRLMGASVKMIDRHYGHLAHDWRTRSAPCSMRAPSGPQPAF